MKSLISTVFILYSCLCIAQKRVEFKIAKYNIDGVIFNDTCDLGFKIDSLSKKFTPSINNIKTVETYFLFNSKTANYADIANYSSTLLPKIKFCKRQYVGYIKNNGDSIIIINFLNFRHKNRQETSKGGSIIS